MRPRLAVLLSVLALLTACGSAAPAPDAPAVGDAAQSEGSVAVPQLDFTLATVAGGEISGADLAGRDVALWFWAPWCPTCNREAPEVAAALTDLPDDVRVVGVAGRDQLPAMEQFVDRHALTEMEHVADLELQLWQGFAIPGQPAWVFIDGETGAVDTVLGALGGTGLRERIAALRA